MISFDGKMYPSLAESRWADPKTNAITRMSTPSTRRTVGSKRKIWDDADVEVEKRHCGYSFPLIGPIRTIKTPARLQAHESPVLLLPSVDKTKGKRICPSTFKITSSKAICRSLHHPRPVRKMLVPLLARRSSYIFPPTSKTKRCRGEDPDTYTPKRLHKEEDNQALCMHLVRHDHDYQPMPRIRLGPNKLSRKSFSQVKPHTSRSRANSHRHSHRTQAAQSDINRMDCDPKPTKQPIQAIGDSMEIEIYQHPRPNLPDAFLNRLDEHDDALSEIYHQGDGIDGPNHESNQKKPPLLPPVPRRRRLAHIKGTSNRVRGDLETLTIDGDAMAGLVCYPLTGTSVLGWFSSALTIRMITGRDALSYFRRLIGNFMDRPPQPCRLDPCSAWGLLSV